MISEAVKSALRKDYPKASEADLEQIANAKTASNTKAVLAGVPNADDVKFNDEVAEKGKKIILTSVRQGAELTREVFLFIRACKGIDYVEGTFKVAEIRAIKALRDGQPEGEKPIKSLADIAKIQGGAGASSYISVRSRLVKILKDSEELVERLQEWYNFQAKHDAEPQMFVQPDFLDPWGKRYADEKRGWSVFTRDARIAEQCAATLDTRKKALERSKGKEAAAQTGQNGTQHQQGLVSGGRTRDLFPDSTIACWNELVKATHEAMDELDHAVINGVIATAAKALRELVAAKKQSLKDKVQATSSEPSQGIADADKAPDSTRAGEMLPESGTPSGNEAGGMVRPDWLKQEDWAAATETERQGMIDDGQEAYDEENAMMEKGEEQKDAESNEPADAKVAGAE